MKIKKTASIAASSALAIALIGSSVLPASSALAAAPPITITSPSGGSTINSTTQTIAGVTAPGMSVSLSIDGGSAIIVPADGAGNWSYIASGLSNGAHTISASVVGDSYAYMPNAGGSGNPYISVVNVTTDTITKTISANGNITGGVAVNPTGANNQNVYVTSGNQVSVINPIDDTISSSIAAGAGPRNVSYNPAGGTAYVANFGLSGNSTVSIINPPAGSAYAGVVGSQAFGSAMNTAGTKLYIANYSGGSVSVLDNLGNIVTAVPVGSNPVGVAADPFSSKVYVTNANDGTVSVIDSSTDSVVATIAVGGYPLGVVFHPSAPLAYVANGSTNSVSVISTTTNSVLTSIPVSGINPYGIDINPTGNKVYVASVYGGGVSVIDTLTNTQSGSIPVGGMPYFIGRFITPALKNSASLSWMINTNTGGGNTRSNSGNASNYNNLAFSSNGDQGNTQNTQENGKNSDANKDKNGEVKSEKTQASDGFLTKMVNSVKNSWLWILLLLAALAIPFFWLIGKRRKKKEDK